MKTIHKVNQGVREAEDRVYINHDASSAKEWEMFKGVMTEMKDKGETVFVKIMKMLEEGR